MSDEPADPEQDEEDAPVKPEEVREGDRLADGEGPTPEEELRESDGS